jgi:hypothetical protein
MPPHGPTNLLSLCLRLHGIRRPLTTHHWPGYLRPPKGVPTLPTNDHLLPTSESLLYRLARYSSGESIDFNRTTLTSSVCESKISCNQTRPQCQIRLGPLPQCLFNEASVIPKRTGGRTPGIGRRCIRATTTKAGEKLVLIKLD